MLKVVEAGIKENQYRRAITKLDSIFDYLMKFPNSKVSLGKKFNLKPDGVRIVFYKLYEDGRLALIDEAKQLQGVEMVIQIEYREIWSEK